MITEDRQIGFLAVRIPRSFERGQEENVYVDLLGEHLSQEYTRGRAYADRHVLRCRRYFCRIG